MAEYYVIKDKNTGLYFRGKGVNRWGKYFNQASIYRVKGMAKHMIEEISWRGEQAEVVPIHIIEPTADVVEVKHGEWVVNAWDGKDWLIIPYKEGQHTDPFCSRCKEPAMRGSRSGHYEISNYCPNCGAKMDGGTK